MSDLTAEELARRFHETYEELAPLHGYKTRKRSAVPWDEVPKDNKSLMIATAAALVPWIKMKAAFSQPPPEIIPAPTEREVKTFVLAAGGELRITRKNHVDADNHRLLWFEDHLTGDKVFRLVDKVTAQASGVALEDAKAGECVPVVLDEEQLLALKPSIPGSDV